jgi:hypothetical protein
MFISMELITGMSVGLEYIDKSEKFDEVGWVFIIDLLILRIMVENL